MGSQYEQVEGVRKDGSARPGPHRRRRWWLLAAAVGIAAILVVVVIPHLLSSGPGTRMVTSVINGRLPGRVAIGEMSLSWTGPTRMTGLKVTDPQGRDVLTLDRLDWSGGLLSALRSPGQLRQIELNAPDVVLSQSAEGTFSIVEALGLSRPDDTRRGALPEISGKVRVAGGRVRIRLADGRQLAVKSIDAEADLQTLSKIDARFSAALDDGGAVSGELSVRELLREGKLDLAAARGRLRLASDEPIRIGPLVGFAFGRGDVTGSLGLEVTGDLAGSIRLARTEKHRIDIDLTGTVHGLDLNWPSEKGHISEEQASFALRGRVDTKAERIDVHDLDLRAETLSARLAGSILRYRSDRMLDLTGHYAGSWRRLTALLHQLAPETSQTVALSGRALREGQITLPVTAIGASAGVLRLGGVVDLQSEEPVLTIAAGLRVLENIHIDQDLSRQLLSRLNPIFSDLTQIDGEVSLLMHRGEFPLGEGFGKGGTGSGRLELQGVRLLPRGLLGRLLELANVPGAEPMGVSFNEVDFVIADGRIEYDDFTVRIATFLDLRFRGSVGFDDRVDLAVSLPIVPSLLERLGASGPAADYARVLTGTRIELPIIGTRLKPRIDFSAVDLTGLLREATRKLFLETPARIEEILRPGKPAPGPTTQAEADAPATAPSPPQRGTPRDDLMEALWDLLGGLEKTAREKGEEGQ